MRPSCVSVGPVQLVQQKRHDAVVLAGERLDLCQSLSVGRGAERDEGPVASKGCLRLRLESGAVAGRSRLCGLSVRSGALPVVYALEAVWRPALAQLVSPLTSTYSG